MENKLTNSHKSWLPLVIIIGLVTIAALILTAYWWIRFDGLYEILANFELSITGSYSPYSTGIITFGLLIIIGLIPLLIIRIIFLMRKGSLQEIWKPKQANPQIRQKISDSHIWLNQNYYKVLGLGLIIAGIIVGGYLILKGTLAGPLTTISLKQLEESNVASHYIKTTGYALTELAVGINENHSNSFYFPLVENFDDQKAINVVVLTKNLSNYSLKKLTLEGVLSQPIDGFARKLLKDEGLIINDNTWLLEADESPPSLISMGILLIIGCGIIGIFCLVFHRNKVKKRQ